MSIKLFCNWFVQFTILWFYSSLKQAVKPELSSFRVLQSSQLFLLMFNRNWVEIVTNQDQSVYFRFLLNEWWFILLLNTLSIICYLFKPCFRFWINSVHEIRKYKFNEIACSDVLFVVHRYLYKFVGSSGGIGIELATIQNFCSTPLEEDRVDRRIFTPHLLEDRSGGRDRIALLQLP